MKVFMYSVIIDTPISTWQSCLLTHVYNVQVRALSEVLENSQVRICDLEEQLRHNDLLGTTGALELRRLTDENEHLWLRVKKMEEDIK